MFTRRIAQACGFDRIPKTTLITQPVTVVRRHRRQFIAPPENLIELADRVYAL